MPHTLLGVLIHEAADRAVVIEQMRKFVWKERKGGASENEMSFVANMTRAVAAEALLTCDTMVPPSHNAQLWSAAQAKA